MAIDTSNPRTRRAVLMGALGGVAATVVAAVGRSSPVSAADDEPVLVGHAYAATSTTSFNATGLATALTGTGVSGVGVYGQSQNYFGVYGFSSATDQPAILGQSAGDSIALQGYSGTGNAPFGPAKTAVYGYAAQDASARGVTGETLAGRGLNGVATSGTGVFGKSTSGEGVRGTSHDSNGTAGSSASGIASGVYGENTGGGFGTYGRSNVGTAGNGVFGESTAGTGVAGATTTGVAMRATSTGTGLAFRAQGRVAFSTSGLVSVAVGSTTRTIKPGADLVAGSLVLCTLESAQAKLSIQRVTKNISANSFTVYLSAAVAAGNTAKVGWFVIG